MKHSVPSGQLNLLQRSPAEVSADCPTTVSGGWSGRGRGEGSQRSEFLFVLVTGGSALEVTRSQKLVPMSYDRVWD